MAKLDLSQLRKSLDTVMQAAGKAESATRSALNTGSEALKDAARKHGPGILDALKHPGDTGQRIMRAAERADTAGRMAMDKGVSFGKLGLGALAMKTLDVLGDERLSGLGGRRGLEAKIKMAKGGLRLADLLTANGRKIDPSLSGVAGKPYLGSWYQKLYGLVPGLIRRGHTQRTLDALSDNDIRNLNMLATDVFRNPTGTASELLKSRDLATTSRFASDLTKTQQNRYTALAKLTQAAAASRRVPGIRDKIDDALRESVAKRYQTLLEGKHGGFGPIKANIDNAGNIAEWNDDGTRMTWAQQMKGNALVDRGTGQELVPVPGSQAEETKLEYLDVGHAGQKPNLPNARPWRNDVGFGVHNNAGVVNLIDPVYFAEGRGMEDGMQLAKWMANSDIPMGSVMEANIAEQMIRAANKVPDGKRLQIKYLTNGVWGNNLGKATTVPKVLVVNEAGAPFWGEIADEHHMKYLESAGGNPLSQDHVSPKAMEFLETRTGMYNELMRRMKDKPELFDKMRGRTDVEVRAPEKVYGFDIHFGNKKKLTDIDADVALEQLAAKPLSAETPRELAQYAQEVTGVDNLSARDKDMLVDLQMDDARAKQLLEQRHTNLLNDYKKKNTEWLEAQFKMNRDSADPVVRGAQALIDKEGYDNLRKTSDATLAAKAQEYGIATPADARQIVRQVRIIGSKVRPLRRDSFVKQHLKDALDWRPALDSMRSTESTGDQYERLKRILQAAGKQYTGDELKAMPYEQAAKYIQARTGNDSDTLSDALKFLQTGQPSIKRQTVQGMRAQYSIPLHMQELKNLIDGTNKRSLTELLYNDDVVDQALATLVGKHITPSSPEYAQARKALRATFPKMPKRQAGLLHYLVSGEMPAGVSKQDLAGRLRDAGLLDDQTEALRQGFMTRRRPAALELYNQMIDGAGVQRGRGTLAAMYKALDAKGMSKVDQHMLMEYIRNGTIPDGMTELQMEKMLVDSGLIGDYEKAYRRALTSDLQNRQYNPTMEDYMSKSGSAGSRLLDTLGNAWKAVRSGADQAKAFHKYWFTPPELGSDMDYEQVARLLKDSDTFIPSGERVLTRIRQAAGNPGKAIGAVARAPLDLLHGGVWSGNPSALYSRRGQAMDIIANRPDWTDAQRIASMNLMNRARQLTALEGATALGVMGLQNLRHKGDASSAAIAQPIAKMPEVDVVQPESTPEATGAAVEPVQSSTVLEQPSDTAGRKFTYTDILPGLAGLGTGASVYALTARSKALRRHRLIRMLLAAGLGGIAAYGTHAYMNS